MFRELTDYLKAMITPGEPEGIDGIFIHATPGYDWSQHEDESVHGIVMDSSLDSLDEITEAYRALKPGGHLLLANDLAEPTGHTGACYAEDGGFEVRDCIMVPDQPGDGDKMHYVPKAARKEREAGLDHVEPPGGHRVKKNIHPTVKPLAIMKWLLHDAPKDLPVVDPFMGSGSTGIAALQTGHDFIGIEREKEYLTIAEGRVRYWSTREAGRNAAVVKSDLTEITEAREAEPETISLDDLFGL